MASLILRPIYSYDPKELAHKFFERIMKQWPGYRIIDYHFLAGNFIQLFLSR